MDAIGNGMACGVAARYGQGGWRNVGGVNCGAGEFFGQGDGDAAGAGANVGDLQAFAGKGLFAAGAEFAEGEAVQGNFDDVFGFGAGNQNVGSHFQFEAPEFLCAGEVLGWFTGNTARDQFEEQICVRGGNLFFGMGVEPSALAAEDVEEQEFCG